MKKIIVLLICLLMIGAVYGVVPSAKHSASDITPGTMTGPIAVDGRLTASKVVGNAVTGYAGKFDGNVKITGNLEGVGLQNIYNNGKTININSASTGGVFIKRTGADDNRYAIGTEIYDRGETKVRGRLSNMYDNNYVGVFGSDQGDAFSYAGYFKGRVRADGSIYARVPSPSTIQHSILAEIYKGNTFKAKGALGLKDHNVYAGIFGYSPDDFAGLFSGMVRFKPESSAPTCNSDREGAVYYDKEDHRLRLCVCSGMCSWRKIALE